MKAKLLYRKERAQSKQEVFRGRFHSLWGATVMLRHNLDVADGLYNGAIGTVAYIGEPSEFSSFDRQIDQLASESKRCKPLPIYVHFDDSRIGARAAKMEINGKTSVRIDPKTATFDVNGRNYRRTQTPVILSFAVNNR